jgi:hypothetical protein
VTDQHDPVDDWLERDVRPLLPPTGTLNRIRLRARRRKRNQALMAAAGCAVVIAAGVSVPQITAALQGNPASQYVARPSAGAPEKQLQPGPTAQPSKATSAPEVSSATPAPQHSTLTPGTPADDPVPAGFQPTSITFVGTGTGGVVGAAIGQAVGQKCSTAYCTSLAQTSNYGDKWSGLAAPVTGGPNGGAGVSQVRFADLKHGWAFGPALWQTSAGGWPWHQQDTHGLRVLDLEAAGQHAFAVFASCTGTGASYAAGCTSFSLYTSATGSNSWTPVAVPASFQTMTTRAAGSTSLVIAGGTTGYLLTPSGEVLTGAVTGGSWSVAGKAPCAPGPAQTDGSPTAAQLATGKTLLLACGSGNQATIYSSADGASWHRLTTLPLAGPATSLSSNSTGQAVLATTAGLYYSADGGKTWQAASVAGTPAGGFSYVGMTNATQGVALPAKASLGEVFVTSDGGRTWTASPVRGR